MAGTGHVDIFVSMAGPGEAPRVVAVQSDPAGSVEEAAGSSFLSGNRGTPTKEDHSMTATDTISRQMAALNRHDVAAFIACYSADAEVFDPQYPALLKGREAVGKDIADFFAAFPDLAGTATRNVGEGGVCAYELRLTGTHKGPMVGPAGLVPPTNRRIDVGGAVIVRFDGEGRIAEERRYYDLAGLLGQLGLMQ